MVECIVRALKTPESEVPEGSKYLQSVTGRINDNLIYVAQMEVNIVDNDNFTADIYPAVSKTLFKTSLKYQYTSRTDCYSTINHVKE